MDVSGKIYRVRQAIIPYIFGAEASPGLSESGQNDARSGLLFEAIAELVHAAHLPTDEKLAALSETLSGTQLKKNGTTKFAVQY